MGDPNDLQGSLHEGAPVQRSIVTTGHKAALEVGALCYMLELCLCAETADAETPY